MFSKKRTKYVFYPHLDKRNFNEIILKKKEFRINKSKKIRTLDDIEAVADKLCKFRLSDNQKFLKSYISTYTPYNSIMLFHGTGVGKTCSSISIAENFKDFILSSNKKINVILNPSIQDNFKKNIFNIEKLKQGIPTQQCTNDTIMKEAGIDSTDDYDYIGKKINKRINSRYRFLGNIEFSNTIKKLKKFKPIVFEKKIKEMFSGSVMIIDEVHNIKENTSKTKDQMPNLLKEVLSIAENMKLVLLSATPMFDKAEEIVFILDLLLINDKRDVLPRKGLFDSYGFITEKGKQIISEKSTGYISYLRGEHPIKFPKRLYPDIYGDSSLIKVFPSIDINGDIITEKDRIKNLKIIGCEMKGIQLKNYKKLNTKTSGEEYGSFNINGIMASNIVFGDTESSGNIKQIIGDRGLGKLVTKVKNRYMFKDELGKEMFKKKNISNFSTKINKIIENIDRSEGIVFIYSRFIASGIIPLAIALEMNGYSNLGQPLVSGTKENKKKFILITGDNDLSKDTYSKYLKIENENKDGSRVKVIIGSETAAEGLDFRFIREVHILEPWFHFNKLEQVIGRAIRNCSHKDLPFEKRNVLVFMYASVDKKEARQETIDLRMYRMCEKKIKQIAEVEYILKVTSVDCELNKNSNRFTDDIFKKKFRMITSRGTSHMVSLNDEDNSKICNLRKCDYKCSSGPVSSDNNINNTTFDYRNIQSNIDSLREFIQDLFSRQLYYKLDDIKSEFLKNNRREYLDVLYYTLYYLLENRIHITDLYKRSGILSRKGPHFFVRPHKMSGQHVSLHDLRKPITKKVRFLDITNIKSKTKKKQFRNNTFKYSDEINKIKEGYRKKYLGDKKFSDTEKHKLDTLFGVFNIYNYIDTTVKESLLQMLIMKQKKKLINEIEQQMITKLGSNILFTKRDIDPSVRDSDDIFGYKIAKGENKIEYRKFSTDRFIAVTSQDQTKINKLIARRIANEPEPADIIAYLVNKKGSKIDLKIRQKDSSKTKLTQVKTGSICGNEGMKKEKIVEFINMVRHKYKQKGKTLLAGKLGLCAELELYLYDNNLKKQSGKRWYYTAEEAIERELNKKKN